MLDGTKDPTQFSSANFPWIANAIQQRIYKLEITIALLSVFGFILPAIIAVSTALTLAVLASAYPSVILKEIVWLIPSAAAPLSFGVGIPLAGGAFFFLSVSKLQDLVALKKADCSLLFLRDRESLFKDHVRLLRNLQTSCGNPGEPVSFVSIELKEEISKTKIAIQNLGLNVDTTGL